MHPLQFRLVPLDFSSRTGKSLLERARRVAGEWTIRAVPRFERLFRLVSPFAPGLMFVGGQLSATLFDPQSIMLYMFPPELFTDHKGTNNNTDLSDKDKSFIAQMYPH